MTSCGLPRTTWSRKSGGQPGPYSSTTRSSRKGKMHATTPSADARARRSLPGCDGGRQRRHCAQCRPDRRDLAVLDRPGGQVVFPERVDQVGPAFPEADVLYVGARRARGRGEMRVEDGELVAVVLEEPELRVHVQLEPVRRRGGVPATL